MSKEQLKADIRENTSLETPQDSIIELEGDEIRKSIRKIIK
jgi:hypothetical protein